MYINLPGDEQYDQAYAYKTIWLNCKLGIIKKKKMRSLQTQDFDKNALFGNET